MISCSGKAASSGCLASQWRCLPVASIHPAGACTACSQAAGRPPAWQPAASAAPACRQPRSAAGPADWPAGRRLHGAWRRPPRAGSAPHAASSRPRHAAVLAAPAAAGCSSPGLCCSLQHEWCGQPGVAPPPGAPGAPRPAAPCSRQREGAAAERSATARPPWRSPHPTVAVQAHRRSFDFIPRRLPIADRPRCYPCTCPRAYSTG